MHEIHNNSTRFTRSPTNIYLSAKAINRKTSELCSDKIDEIYDVEITIGC